MTPLRPTDVTCPLCAAVPDVLCEDATGGRTAFPHVVRENRAAWISELRAAIAQASKQLAALDTLCDLARGDLDVTPETCATGLASAHERLGAALRPLTSK